MKIPTTELIERLHRATGDADTAQLMEAAANRLEEQDIECATLRHGLRLANRRADEAADRLRQEEIMGQVLRAAQGEQVYESGCYTPRPPAEQGERHQVPCTSRADTICPQPAYCHANGCKETAGKRSIDSILSLRAAQGERQPDECEHQYVQHHDHVWRCRHCGRA